MAARVEPSTSFYREGIVQHGQSPRLMVVCSPGPELLPVCADKALALLPLRNLSPPPGHFKINHNLQSPGEWPLSFCQVFFFKKQNKFPFTHASFFYTLLNSTTHGSFNSNLSSFENICGYSVWFSLLCGVCSHPYQSDVLKNSSFCCTQTLICWVGQNIRAAFSGHTTPVHLVLPSFYTCR